jgi:hypothetical protein
VKFLAMLRRLLRVNRSPDSVKPDGLDDGDLWYEGGDGNTIETAIVIRGVHEDLLGTAAEFHWLTWTFGRKDLDWQLISHSHGTFDDREIDTLELRLPTGTVRIVYFDITESFGR